MKPSIKLLFLFSSLSFMACSKNVAQTGNETLKQNTTDMPPKGKFKEPNFTQLLQKMDGNKDGKISNDEADERLKKDFSKIDTNKDGFITKEEFEKAPKPQRQGPPPSGQNNK
jgi:Ca2+-binding EF-hand superfamily protein